MQFWSGTAFMKPTDAVAVARMLDEAGYDGMVCSDHLIYPRELASPYPDSPTGKPMWAPDTPWPDSWVLIGAMAGVTSRLRFSNAVYVAPARPLLEVAKQVATASAVSQGRVSLAVGVGWMREEFELMGQNFDNRGKRLNEMIPALRALWQGGWVSWDGEHYQVPEMMIEPHPTEPVSILCGGESDAALRRAAGLCDGWVGYAYAWDDAVRYVQRLNALRREYGRENKPFEILLALLEEPAPDLYKRAEDIGITAVMGAPWAGAGDMAPGDVESYGNPSNVSPRTSSRRSNSARAAASSAWLRAQSAEPASETFLSEIVGAQPFPNQHMSMKSLYEYGSRAGLWRVLRVFDRRG